MSLTTMTDFLDRSLDLDNERECVICGTPRDFRAFTSNRRGEAVCWACRCKGCEDDNLRTRDERETGVCDGCKVLADEALEGCLAGVAA